MPNEECNPYTPILPLLETGIKAELRRWPWQSRYGVVPLQDALGAVVQILIPRVPPARIPALPPSFWIKTAQYEARKYFKQLQRERTPQGEEDRDV
jgi:hypothetical protein